ncbi:abortive infection family protein [Solibacillus sp.]|uniref:abortive infection family protein n=1 Tax=Solibacillus sp. TaxID=1909654 RepID=UPI00331452CD
MVKKITLTDDIIYSISKAIDDSMKEKRAPSHSDLEHLIIMNKLQKGDPKFQGHTVGKTKRVRNILYWSMENNKDAGEKFVVDLISLIRAVGGFLEDSSNFIGKEEKLNLQNVFNNNGYSLDDQGNIGNLILDNLSELEKEKALMAYVQRAKKGQDDAALLAGTSKDLLEAVAAHILLKKFGTYPETANFPTLLGQAFISLNLATGIDESVKYSPVERVKIDLQKKLYELGCSINKLRNKTGTGHGRPFIPELSDSEARLAIESMAVISEYLLKRLNERL